MKTFKETINKGFIVFMYIVFRIITYPFYFINKLNFNRKRKKNPFYKSLFVRFLEDKPWFYELSMFILNFPYPTYVYKILPELQGDVLQIGCGTGLFNKYYSKHYNDREVKFTNLDINIKYLEYGIRKERYTNFICKDICKMDDFKQQYDYIVFIRCFHHIKNHKKAFENCNRMLKDNGVIIIADPVILEKRTENQKLCDGYRVNSSIDGVIWRFSKANFENYIEKKLPEDLFVSEAYYKRLFHITNWNLKYPQIDARITIKKVKEIS